MFAITLFRLWRRGDPEFMAFVQKLLRVREHLREEMPLIQGVRRERQAMYVALRLDGLGHEQALSAARVAGWDKPTARWRKGAWR